jgi:hypothetical protein
MFLGKTCSKALKNPVWKEHERARIKSNLNKFQTKEHPNIS